MGTTISLHESQKKFLFEKPKARIRAAISGVRGGKTYVGVTAMANDLQHIYNKDVMIAAPSYKMLESVSKHEFLKIYQDNIDWKRKNERDRIYYDYNNNRIFFRSADDPDSIRGIGIDRALLDEASYMKEDFFDITLQRVADREGTIYITTTPRGNNWLRKKVWARRNDPDVFCINWRSVDNPKFPLAEWERLKKISDPIWFAQEYEGKFVGFGGAIFQHTYNPEVHVTDFFDYDPDLPLFCGMDFGINNPNVTIFAQVQKLKEPDGSERPFLGIIDELWLRNQDMFMIMPKVIGKFNRKPKYIACDPAGKTRDQTIGKSCIAIIKKEFGITPRYRDKWNTWPERLVGINEIHKLLRTNSVYFHSRTRIIQEAMESLSYPSNTDRGILDEVYVKDGYNDHPFEAFLYLTLSKPIVVAMMELDHIEQIEEHGQHYDWIHSNINRYTGFH